MPTTKPRHAITETDDVVAALDAAAQRWPEDSDKRGRLLLRLIDEGHRAISQQSSARSHERLAAVEYTHGSMAGVYADDYLDRLREDWPQ